MKAATAVEATAPAAVETSTPATVETSAPAAAMGVGGIWLAECGHAQQSNGDASQSRSCTEASSLFA
jgi:hypothetical protein